MLGSAQNQLQDVLHVLKKRRWQILLPAALVLTLGASFSVIVPKEYRLQTRIEINETTRLEPDFQLRNTHEMAIRREVPSFAEHIQHYERIKRVVELDPKLWPEYVAGTEDEQQAFPNEIWKRITVGIVNDKKNSGTTSIDVAYQDRDPERAVRFLDALIHEVLKDLFTLDLDMLRAERDSRVDLVHQAEAAYDEVSQRYFALTEQLGQDPNKLLEDGGGGRFQEAPGDWYFRELDAHKTAREKLQEELASEENQLDIATKRFEAEPSETTDWVAAAAKDVSKEIDALQKKIEVLQENLDRYRPDNSSYKTTVKELEEAREDLRHLVSGEGSDSQELLTKPNPRKEEYLRAKLDKADLVENLRHRIEFADRQIEDLEETARVRTHQFEELWDLRNELALKQGQLNQHRAELELKNSSIHILEGSPTPWKISRPAIVSGAKVVPNPWLIVGFAGAAGLALGLLFAMANEYARNSYRTVSDLSSVMTVPVLGAIHVITTRREKRRAQAQRALAGLSTAVIVGGLGWITWMWHSAPERLPVEVQRAIERFRDALA